MLRLEARSHTPRALLLQGRPLPARPRAFVQAGVARVP